MMHEIPFPIWPTPNWSASWPKKPSLAMRCLRDVARDYAPVVFANSLGAEDMVLTDMIWREDLAIDIFSLDTGRLPAETYELMAKARTSLRQAPEGLRAAPRRRAGLCRPQRHQRLLRFGRSAQGLLPCAQGRTAAARAGRQAGLDHRPARGPVANARQAARWWPSTTATTWSRSARWPTGANAKSGSTCAPTACPTTRCTIATYPSIGCAPCTRAVQPGEDVRAGRWWWENPGNQGVRTASGRRQAADGVTA